MPAPDGVRGQNERMRSALETAFAEEWPRVVGAILRAFGSVDVAEESAQEAFARAADRIAAGEELRNIGAWVTTTARHVAVDLLRREAALRHKLPLFAEPEAREDSAQEFDMRNTTGPSERPARKYSSAPPAPPRADRNAKIPMYRDTAR